MPLLLKTAVMDTGLTGTDWLLYVVLPALLLVAGLALFLMGRSAHRDATRIRGGFGGPAGTADIGTQLGFDGSADPRPLILAAQRKMLWGGILMVVGAIWLIVGLLTQAV